MTERVRRSFGPGMLVTAAFIGPGTITTASVAGAGAGYVLVWALAFSIVATLVLQEMAARIGLVGDGGLAEQLRAALTQKVARAVVLGLVVVAIGVGNAAYEAGNITGAVLGASALLDVPRGALVLGITVLAALLLFSGRYRLLETTLAALVAFMGVVFVAAALSAPPDVALMFSVPAGADAFGLTALALIGTTVVPYNLFLHASAVRAHWGADADALPAVRRDTCLGIGFGGLVTLAILSTAAVAFAGTGTEVSAESMAAQLEPVLGGWAATCFALGLLAAGLTSAITAPLAAAWAVCGALGWSTELRSRSFRMVWAVVLASGAVTTLAGFRPIAVILIAQVTNALLLPIIAGLLLWLVNRSALGSARNGALSNVLAASVLLVVLALSFNRFVQMLG